MSDSAYDLSHCVTWSHYFVMCLTFQAVCNRLGIDTGDRLSPDSKKRKFLVIKMPDDDDVRLFEVSHVYEFSYEQATFQISIISV